MSNVIAPLNSQFTIIRISMALRESRCCQACQKGEEERGESLEHCEEGRMKEEGRERRERREEGRFVEGDGEVSIP